MGAAVGDFDGDGRLDLFVTGWRDQRLYRNLGNGRFEDVTIRAGVSSDLWSTSAAFADLDGDGDQDLYVANYLDFDPKSPPDRAHLTAAAIIVVPKIFLRNPTAFTATMAMARSRKSPGWPESTNRTVGIGCVDRRIDR